MADPRRDKRTTAALRQAAGRRDNWTCYRCHQPVDPTLPWRHPRSATLEHIRNLCDGGDPYDLANCAVSHRLCNTRAGASEGGRRRHRTKDISVPW